MRDISELVKRVIKISLIILPLIIIIGIIVFINYNGNCKYIFQNALFQELANNIPDASENNNEQSFYIAIIFSEGLFGYYVNEDQIINFNFDYNPLIENSKNKIEETLTRKIADCIGLQYIEHSKNNTILLHFIRENNSKIYCTVNRGGGWEDVCVQ